METFKVFVFGLCIVCALVLLAMLVAKERKEKER